MKRQLAKSTKFLFAVLFLVAAIGTAHASNARLQRLQRDARRELGKGALEQARAGVEETTMEALRTSRSEGKKHLMFVAFDYERDLMPLLSLAQTVAENFSEITVSLAVGKRASVRLRSSGISEEIIYLPGGTDTLFSLDLFTWEELALLGVGNADELGFSVPLSNSARVLYETFSRLNGTDLLPDLVITDQWCWAAMEASHLFQVPYIVNIPHMLSSKDSPFADELLPYSTPLLGSSLWLQPWVRWARMIGTRVLALLAHGDYHSIRKHLFDQGIDPELWQRSAYVFDDRVAGHIVLTDSTYGIDLLPADRPLESHLQIVGDLFSSYELSSDLSFVEELLFRSNARGGSGTLEWDSNERLTRVGERKQKRLDVEKFLGEKDECLLVSLDNRLVPSSKAFFSNVLPSVLKQSNYRRILVNVFMSEQTESISNVFLDDERVNVIRQEDISFLSFLQFGCVSTVLSTCAAQEIISAAAAGVRIICAPLSIEQELYANKAVESGIAEMLSANLVKHQLGRQGNMEESYTSTTLARYSRIAGGAKSAAELIHAFLFTSGCEEYLIERNAYILAATVEAGYVRDLPVFWQLQPILGVVIPLFLLLALWCRVVEPALRFPFKAKGKGLTQASVRSKKNE